MRWPPWSSTPSDSDSLHRSPAPKRPSSSTWSSLSLPTDWRQYTSPDVVLPTLLLTSTIFAGRHVYKRCMRRITGATNIPPAFWRKRSLLGHVTSVGDGDGFRLFHTPGGRLLGWGLMPGRKVPTGVKELKDKTISIRIAGVDAPERAHFGKPAQPGSKEALDWLTSYINGRRVRVYVYRRDQYDRAVASVYVWRGLLRRDVGLQMLKRGLATVYEAKTGAEFGNLEGKYRKAEKWAKDRRKGIWANKNGESPREYKTRTARGGGEKVV